MIIERQEAVAIALFVVCPACGAKILEIGPNLLSDVGCPHCKRLYTITTRKLMRKCYEENGARK